MTVNDAAKERTGRQIPQLPSAIAVLLTCAVLCACGSAQPQTQQSEAAVEEPVEAPVFAPEDRIIYLVLTDRFFDGDPSNDGPNVDTSQLLSWHGGDFAGLVAKLPYLRQLGVTTLWITPVVEQIDHPVEGAGLDHWGYHGYWAESFDRLEPQLGDEEDLRALIDATHAAGMDIVLDIVLNHSGYGSHFDGDPAWTRACTEEFESDLTFCLFGLPDFLTENPEVAAQLIEWQTAWFRAYPFDGVRADTVKHVEVEVWRDFLAAVRATNPDGHFWTLGESWGSAPQQDEPLLADGMFDAMYDFGFSELVESYLSGRMRSAALAHHLEQRNDLAIGRYVHYLNTHDTVPMTARLENPDSYPLALFLLMTSSGIPLLYYGDELAREGGEWPNNRPDMLWDRVEPPVAALTLTRELIAFRRSHPSLTRGSLTNTESNEGLVIFAREVEGERLVIGVNRGPEEAAVSCGETALCEPLICLNCRPEVGQVILEPFGGVVLDGAATLSE